MKNLFNDKLKKKVEQNLFCNEVCNNGFSICIGTKSSIMTYSK